MVTKRTVFQDFSEVKHFDKNDQHSLFFSYTIYGVRFFAEFLKKLRMAIVFFNEGMGFDEEECGKYGSFLSNSYLFP